MQKTKDFKQINMTSVFVLDAKLIQRDVNVQGVESTSHLIHDGGQGVFFSLIKKIVL